MEFHLIQFLCDDCELLFCYYYIAILPFLKLFFDKFHSNLFNNIIRNRKLGEGGGLLVKERNGRDANQKWKNPLTHSHLFPVLDPYLQIFDGYFLDIFHGFIEAYH